jgi:hypothetical protein
LNLYIKATAYTPSKQVTKAIDIAAEHSKSESIGNFVRKVITILDETRQMGL